MRDSLGIFLDQDIIPLYDSFDAAHGARHVSAVTESAVAAGTEAGLDPEMCAVAAAYHDIGLRFGRENHHLTSAELMRGDERLREWFTEAEIEEMSIAVEDHRASSERPARTLLGKVLADADREYTVERIVSRTMAYGRAHYPDMDEEGQLRRTREHIEDKYGKNGYMSFYIWDERKKKTRAEILALLEDGRAFREACMKYGNEPDRQLDTAAYLRRIGAEGPCPTTAETLFELQMKHLRAVPYENMDILRGVPLTLDRRALYDKIVTRRRGGFCFELNELYGWLLRALGFHVKDMFARFLAGETEIPMRRHHVLVVNVPGSADRYLCDVGVGSGSPTWPVKLAEDEIQQQPDAVWKLTKDARLGWVLNQLKHGKWQAVFSFTEEPQLPVDFGAACFWCEHAEASPFNKQPMISLRTPEGRVTLDGSEYRVFAGDSVSVSVTDDILGTLKDSFGIVL